MNRPLRLAYLSPLPPARTGIADYSRALLPHLAKLAEIAVFSEQDREWNVGSQTGVPAFPLSEYGLRRWHYDLAIYQMGNSGYHEAIGQLLLRYPGIMVLHDVGLHQLWAGQSLTAGRPAIYYREMGYALGLPGLTMALEVEAGSIEPPHFEVPLNDRFVDAALAIIVHSHFAREQVVDGRQDRLATVIPAPIDIESAASLRQGLDLPANACLFGSFGLVSHTKQLQAALQAFAAVRKTRANLYYLIVGEWQARDVDVPALVESLGLDEAVRYTGFVATLAEFMGWLAAVDVAVNLRYPTVGETSAAGLRALAAGRALIVYDHGWYAELPSDACLKVTPLDDDALRAAMERLATDPQARQAMGARGAAYVRQHHSPAAAAASYISVVNQLLDDRVVAR